MKPKCKHAENCEVLKRYLTKNTPEEINEQHLNCYSQENPSCDLHYIGQNGTSKYQQIIDDKAEETSRKSHVVSFPFG
ncbi:MAG: hypothetical protein GOV02_03550 [Candidatus Aenigmarchaeota archaeon]|nr:hypothetical protein [Candidatus Aenigmarchaeota archaeon]